MSAQVQETARFYRDTLDFRVVEHAEGEERFAALYKDGVEILLVQTGAGVIRPNRDRYGTGYDLYLTPPDVDQAYEFVRDRGGKVVRAPSMTAYGNYEFVLEDPEKRWIGIGLNIKSTAHSS